MPVVEGGVAMTDDEIKWAFGEVESAIFRADPKQLTDIIRRLKITLFEVEVDVLRGRREVE